MLRKIIGIMEMDNTLLMGLHNFPGQQQAFAQISGDLAGHIIPLGRIDHGIFIGILLFGLLVAALDQAQNPVVGGIAPPDQR